MEVHIKDIDNDLYITFDSAMNILDEIQRLRKVNYKLEKELKHKVQQYEYLRHNNDKEIERMQKTIDTLINIDTEHMDRIDKAREYIKESKDLSVDSYYKFNELCEADDLLNILDGGYEE